MHVYGVQDLPAFFDLVQHPVANLPPIVPLGAYFVPVRHTCSENTKGCSLLGYSPLLMLMLKFCFEVINSQKHSEER